MPLKTTIDTIHLIFDSTTAVSKTLKPPITNYVGHPLYCHVIQFGGEGAAIIFNENAPSSYDPGATGSAVQMVTVVYNNLADGPQTTSVVLDQGNTYNGRPLEFHLEFAPDMSTATLVMSQIDPDAGSVISGKPTLGLIVMTPAVTGDVPIGHFVNVPLDKVVKPAHLNFKTASISFPTTGAGSVSGPIGSVTVP